MKDVGSRRNAGGRGHSEGSRLSSVMIHHMQEIGTQIDQIVGELGPPELHLNYVTQKKRVKRRLDPERQMVSHLITP